MKQLKCPSTDEWIKKMWEIYIHIYVYIYIYIHIYMCVCVSIWPTTLPIVQTWMDMDGTMLNEISHTGKILCGITYM